ncbi:MAG: MFS transporter [Chloroflexi bacterium]|nr:MFS transporter [Chloroflexota bacterium]
MRGRLSKESAPVLVFQALFNFGSSFSALFVNVYLWRLKSSLESIAFYNFCVYVSLLFWSLVCGKVIEKRGEVFCLRAGIMLYTTFYSSILLLQERSGDFLIPLGLLAGMAAAFLFMGSNSLIARQTHNRDRDFFFGALAAVSGMGAIIVQPVSGSIISHFSGLQGYSIIFSLSAGLYLCAIITSFWLPRSRGSEVFHFSETWRAYRNDPRWRGVGLSMFIASIRGGLYGFLITILAYLTFKDEWGLSRYSMVMSTVTLLAAFTVGRMLTAERRVRFYFLGASFSLIASLILVIWSGKPGFLLYGLLFNAASPLRDIPTNTISYEVIDDLNRQRGMRFTYVIAREVPINLGRLVGIGLFLLLYRYAQSDWVIKLLIPAVTTLELSNVFIFRWIKHQSNTSNPG